MARNSEKAMTALARWRKSQLGDEAKVTRRPYLATECDEVKQCERWRRQIIGEVSRKVAQIQNAGLGEFKLRDLNDEINKLLREKGHWEDRIKELGGPDYRKIGPKMLDYEGKEVPGNRGYKYFGAAKDLPGVRELFQQEPPPPPRKTRVELMKDIDADYYGYRDEDDGVLVPFEKEAEKRSTEAKLDEYRSNKEAALALGESSSELAATLDVDIYAKHVQVSDSDEDESESQSKRSKQEEGISQFIAHVPVPSQQEIEEALLQRKKQELLQKYASDSLQSESTEAQEMLGV